MFFAYLFTTFLPYSFPTPVRHAQHVHTGRDATHVHRGGLYGRDESRPYKPLGDAC